MSFAMLLPEDFDALESRFDSQKEFIEAYGLSEDELELLKVAQHGNVERTAELLHQGVNPNLQIHMGQTLLQLVINSEIDWDSPDETIFDSQVLELLLKHGADPNVTDSLNRTALDWAFGSGGEFPIHPRAVQLLSKYGAKRGSELAD